MFKDKIVWKVDTFLLLTYDKVFILEVIDRQNNNICNKKLTNMFTIIVSFRSSNNTYEPRNAEFKTFLGSCFLL